MVKNTAQFQGGWAQFATIPRHLRHGSATPAGPVHNAPAPRLPLPAMRSQALLYPAESQAVAMPALPLPDLGAAGRHLCLDQATPAHLDAGHLPAHPVHTPRRLFLFTVRGPIVYG